MMRGIFLEAGEGVRPSFGLKSVLHGRSLLKHGLQEKIGNGSSIRVWCDPWIGDENQRIPLMKNIFINIDLRVCDLLAYPSGSWNLDILDDLFYQQDIV